jgi:DNA-binding IclR family transcriptional regulator
MPYWREQLGKFDKGVFRFGPKRDVRPTVAWLVSIAFTWGLMNSRASMPNIKKGKPMAGSAPDVKSARRILEILEFLAQRREGLAVSDVCRHLDFPQSSTSALLKSLVALGYLDYSPEQRRYFPTVRVAFLGYWLYADLFSGGGPLKIAERLHALTQETISIGVRSDIHVVYLRILQSTKSLQYFLDPRIPRPLYHSAVGRALMMSIPDQEAATIIKRINKSPQVSPINISSRRLMEELKIARRRGYVFLESSWISGAASIAMPIPTPPGFPMLAVAIGGPIRRLQTNRKELVAILRKTLDDYRKGNLI